MPICRTFSCQKFSNKLIHYSECTCKVDLLAALYGTIFDSRGEQHLVTLVPLMNAAKEISLGFVAFSITRGYGNIIDQYEEPKLLKIPKD